MPQECRTQGVHHVGLTVPNIQQTRDFFVEVLGFTQVGEKPTYPAVFVSDGHTMLTLWQAADPEHARSFDRSNCIGLHHLALSVDQDTLQALHSELLKREDCRVEFAPEPLGADGMQHMMTRIPGGLRIEFVAAGS